jgi:phosphate-selective porin
MRKFALITAASLFAATATVAQEAAPTAAAAPAASSTVSTILEKGMTMSAQGYDFNVKFNADGTYDAELFYGTYKAEGPEICMDIPDAGMTFCSTYPEGKTSGDTFSVDTENGPVDVTIK